MGAKRLQRYISNPDISIRRIFSIRYPTISIDRTLTLLLNLRLSDWLVPSKAVAVLMANADRALQNAFDTMYRMFDILIYHIDVSYFIFRYIEATRYDVRRYH